MFPPKTPREKTGLEKEIDRLLLGMQELTPYTVEYSKTADQLEKLYKLKVIDKPERISLDTLAIIAGNLLGIVMIVGYERTNIVTSKALSLLLRIR